MNKDVLKNFKIAEKIIKNQNIKKIYNIPNDVDIETFKEDTLEYVSLYLKSTKQEI